MKKNIVILTTFALLIGGLIFAQDKSYLQGDEQNQNLEQHKEDILPTMPQPEFIQPRGANELKETAKIKIRVEEAQSVEFYLRRPESLQENYLGKAVPSQGESNHWELDWDTTQTPNGDYSLFAKITNQYGEYSGSGTGIKVNNMAEREEEKEQDIAQQVQQIEEIEKSQDEKAQATRETIAQKNQDSTKEGMKLLTPEKKEEAKRDVEQKSEESSAAIEENVQKLKEKTREEVKAPPEAKEKIKNEIEEIKKDTIEKNLAPLKSIEARIEEEAKPKVLEMKEKAETEIKSQLEQLENTVRETEKAKQGLVQKTSKDSDSDGLSDGEEIRLKTDPFNPDTDGDGFIDGAEIARGYDPTKPGAANKIVYQDPRKAGPKEADIYKLERVEMVNLPSGEKGLKLEGRGRPNSFVTLYVFSSFLVLTTRTNENGYWEYVLDKPLEEGSHEVYVAVTNNQGEITSRSETFPFTLAAGAVAAVAPATGNGKSDSPVEVLEKSFAILVVSLIILVIGIALLVIGIFVRKEASHN